MRVSRPYERSAQMAKLLEEHRSAAEIERAEIDKDINRFMGFICLALVAVILTAVFQERGKGEAMREEYITLADGPGQGQRIGDLMKTAQGRLILLHYARFGRNVQVSLAIEKLIDDRPGLNEAMEQALVAAITPEETLAKQD